MMNKYWTILVVLLILATVSAVSCTLKESKLRSSDLYIDQVNALINAPMKQLGDGRGVVQDKLGTPSAAKTEQIVNRHDRTQTDQIHTITYPGLIIRIYDVVAFKKDMLISVRMTENHPGLLPALIGKDKRAIKAMFGVPNRRAGTVFKYTTIYDGEPGEDIVKIEFHNSIVEAIEWNFYID